ncbi:hypothetical protein tinsulaeT_35990 [Thalassotalea insulae]|uniref:Uncharacterized protein n=2 Tax=Thalassotalea insulae TaxID=2056778 RepID=A0ABQ6GYE7_9GAMM|nr:hypothetical protein tinsulaeT_35990 [Thalassotalea insulae]
MNNFRVFLSISIFIVSGYFIIDLALYSFDWLLLCCSLIGFTSSHYLWPPNYDDESAWYDGLEVVIDLPFRAIALFFRGLGKLVKNADSGLDL